MHFISLNHQRVQNATLQRQLSLYNFETKHTPLFDLNNLFSNKLKQIIGYTTQDYETNSWSNVTLLVVDEQHTDNGKDV